MSNKFKKPESFESAMLRLEQIADELENGETELEKSLELYEEGARLAAWCTETLGKARQKVTEFSDAVLSAQSKEDSTDE